MTPPTAPGSWTAGKRAFRLALLAGLLTAVWPCAAMAQAVSQVEEPLPSSPLEVLVESRGVLALTAGQIDELGRIRKQLAVTNEPLVTRMMALRAEWQQERRSARRSGQRADLARIARIRADAARMRARIQENNREAMRTVNRLLSPAQRKQLRSIVAARRPLDPGRGAGSDLDAGAGN